MVAVDALKGSSPDMASRNPWIVDILSRVQGPMTFEDSCFLGCVVCGEWMAVPLRFTQGHQNREFGHCLGMDMKVARKSTCFGMDNVWWSNAFYGETTKIGTHIREEVYGRRTMVMASREATLPIRNLENNVNLSILMSSYCCHFLFVARNKEVRLETIIILQRLLYEVHF